MAYSKTQLPPRSESPDEPDDSFCLESVDLTEQAMIQAQITRNKDLCDQELQEALKRSLSDIGMLSDSDITSGLNSVHVSSNNNGGSDTMLADVEAAAASSDAPASRNNANLIDFGDDDTSVADRSQRGHYQQQGHQQNSEQPCNLDLVNGHASEEQYERERRSSLECASNSQSENPVDMGYRSERRPSLERTHQHRPNRRPSPEQTNGYRSERRPSLERAYQARSERRPSLERTYQDRSERRPSLERAYQARSERRSSLERNEQYSSQRRPSLERARGSRSERRPSLERDETGRRRSLERVEQYQSERKSSLERGNRYRRYRSPSPDRAFHQRRPSLEHLEQHGLQRRSSQELLQSAAEHVQSMTLNGASSGSDQGINTLHPPSPNDNGIPLNWDMSQLPRPGEKYRLVQLSPMDSEHSAITVDFEEAGLKIHTVERLQNLELLDVFNQEKKHLLKHRPSDFALNERYLYHGTQAEHQRLCEEGLDFRLSFQGCFGNGTYFSDNPRKCMQYARRNDAGDGVHPIILVCRVVLGESKVYDQGVRDSHLKREPERPRCKGGERYYDSVQGIPVDYPEFVVYRNNRSMIEYIVTFEEVGYRSPPSHNNFYKSQAPASSNNLLYKCEPVVLPIPEEEIDKLYMLGPDTDSDGSCDEHTREVEMLRENVKRGKAKRLGIPFRMPTKEEKRYERLHWKRVCYYSCPPGSPLYEAMIAKKKDEKEARRKKKAEKRKAEAAASASASLSTSASASDTASASASASVAREGSKSSDQTISSHDQYDMDDENVTQVLDLLICDFLKTTCTDNMEVAKKYIMENKMDLNEAVDHFFGDNS